MFSITIITGLASLCGCLCMALVCAAQIAQIFAAARPPAQHGPVTEFSVPAPASTARVTITPATSFMPRAAPAWRHAEAGSC